MIKEDCKECTPDQPCKKHWQRNKGESDSDYENRKVIYELTGIRDESLHVQPYADMIDKLTYVQKADFAKCALELERDCATYKKMFEEVSRERNAWISEYRAAREEVERLKQERKQIIEENASQAMKISFLEPYKERYESAILEGDLLRTKNEELEERIIECEGDYQDICELAGRICIPTQRKWLIEQIGEGEWERFKNHIGW